MTLHEWSESELAGLTSEKRDTIILREIGRALDQLRTINGSVAKLHSDVYGDSARGIDGALPLSRSNCARLDRYDDLTNRAIGAAIGLTLLGGSVGGFVVRLLG